MKKNLNILSLILFILFIILSILMKLNLLANIDSSIQNIITNIRNNKLDNLIVFITNSLNIYLSIIVCLILLIKNKKCGIFLIINLIFILLTNLLLKYIFLRQRPELMLLIKERGYSYPSGHSMVSLFFIGTLSYLLYKKIKNKGLKISIIISSILLIILIGFTRIYLNVHYFTDVIGGFLISSSLLILIINYHDMILNKLFKRSNI